jgi:rhamnose utilization protein RhaD (predicted bifunctional aldolase and dehydrogenase)
MDENLAMLIELSHQLADPAFNLAILGEGNTSTRCDQETFWVKASGSQLATIDSHGFSRVNGRAVLDLLDNQQLSDAEIETGLKSALADKSMKKPSVETFLHAICLFEIGVDWVAHTHPISAMSILCSTAGADPFKQHIFPDEIVVCGQAPVVIPYIDPGLPLARYIRNELKRYLDAHGEPPKLMLMENHGIVALGMQPADVLNISLMADKWSRTILGTYTMGGPKYLSQEQVERIDTRPDEAYRRRLLSSLN